jgi:uncharacterized protein (TIGR00661 family)
VRSKRKLQPFILSQQGSRKGKTVVVAPLDWGLGHATRCIPIIRYLLGNGHKVVIVASGRPLQLLKKEFPKSAFYDVPSYNIVYQKRGSFLVKVTIQLRKILGGILRENRALRTIVARENPDLIISDNRYGIRHKNIYNVMMTHQVMVKIPGSRLVEWVVMRWIRYQLNKFNAVWIPDAEGHPNLSGDLSHKPAIQTHYRFIGLLNRFDPPDTTPTQEYDVLCILSGPEPQRSIFEEKIMAQARQLRKKIVIVQGVSEKRTDQWVNEHIRLVSHAHARKLMDLIAVSKVIVSRGGYTTLMDLAPLGKQCIFVPTPGQTEQEYLVKDLAHKGYCVYMSQKQFDLAHALERINQTHAFRFDIPVNTFPYHVEEALWFSE